MANIQKRYMNKTEMVFYKEILSVCIQVDFGNLSFFLFSHGRVIWNTNTRRWIEEKNFHIGYPVVAMDVRVEYQLEPSIPVYFVFFF
jgi:hypothetical protein